MFLYDGLSVLLSVTIIIIITITTTMSRFYKFLAIFLIPFIAVGGALKDQPTLPIANMGQMSFAFWQGATATPLVTATYLVVGGGGSAGSGVQEIFYNKRYAGGGGGGGVLTGTANFTSGNNYSVTVGAGGAYSEGGYTALNGNNGGNSSIIGTGVSITALGGGYGAGNSNAGGYGGNGGGGSNGASGGSAPTGGYSGGSNSGGGGGAGGGGGSNRGNGGNGLASSITGVTMYYGAGGAGYGQSSSPPLGGYQGPAPYTGYGYGCFYQSNGDFVGSFFTFPNSGSGGGAQSGISHKASDGIVIISLPDTAYATYTGTYTTTTNGTNIVYSLTTSGTLTVTSGAVTQIITYTNTDSYHQTDGTATWTCPAGITSINVLLVGGGGPASLGGGGGGGVVLKNNVTVNPGTTYNLTVGYGGSITGYGNATNTTMFGFTAYSGGGGGNYSGGGSGGSGGGASAAGGASGGAATQPSSATGGYGNAGGNSIAGGPNELGSGGGGAGGPGTAANITTNTPGNGGDGYYYALTGKYYGGGGGGAYGRTGANVGTNGLGNGVQGSGGGGRYTPNTGYAAYNGSIIISYTSTLPPIHGYQYYRASSGTWVCPNGVYKAYIALVGGGGGGFGGNPGGGGGTYDFIKNVTPGTSYSWTIGNGGGRNVSGGNTVFSGTSVSGGDTNGNSFSDNVNTFNRGSSAGAQFTSYGGGAASGQNGGDATSDDGGGGDGSGGTGATTTTAFHYPFLTSNTDDIFINMNINVYDIGNPYYIRYGSVGGGGADDFNNENQWGYGGNPGAAGRAGAGPMTFGIDNPSAQGEYGRGYYYDGSANFVGATPSYPNTGAGGASDVAGSSGYILIMW